MRRGWGRGGGPGGVLGIVLMGDEGGVGDRGGGDDLIERLKDPKFSLKKLNYFLSLFEDIQVPVNQYTSIKKMEGGVRGFTSLNLNINSLKAKRNELLLIIKEIEALGISIVTIQIQECFEMYDSIGIPGFVFYTATRLNSLRGGVCTFVNSKFNSSMIFKKVIDFNFESNIVKIEMPGRKFLQVANIYHPPSAEGVGQRDHFTNFLINLSDFLDKIDITTPTIISGDFNLDLSNTANREEYLEIWFKKGFLLNTYLASRIVDLSHFSFIDHCFTNSPQLIDKIDYLVTESPSDHCVILTHYRHNSFNCMNFDSNKTEEYQDFSQQSINKFKNKLDQISWCDVTRSTCTQEAFNLFYKKFYDVFDKHFVLKRRNKGRTKCKIDDFYTDTLLKHRKKVKSLYRQSIIDPSKKGRYRRYNNAYNRLVIHTKAVYVKNLIRSNHNNPRKLWQVISNLWKPSKTCNDRVKCLQDDQGRIFSDDENICQIFNTYFTNFTNPLVASLPMVPGANFKDYLGEPCVQRFYLSNTNRQELSKTLDNFNPKKSKDINGLSMFVCKQIKDNILDVLVYLFNLSFTNGYVPCQFKTSRTVPIPKKGDITLPSNYRGISLIETISKIIEKLMHTRLYNYFTYNNLFYHRQYGFRRKTGTDHCLIDIINLISENMATSNVSSVLSLDVMKAFDVVDWQILFHKLWHYGIRGRALAWFRSYFQGRRQRICCNGIIGRAVATLLRGVLQGSILGTLLFLIFINDLPQSLRKLISLLFADDNQLFNAAADILTLAEEVNDDLKRVVAWYLCNRLPIHPGKSTMTIFHHNFINDKYVIPIQANGEHGLCVFVDYNVDDTLPYDENKKTKITLTNLDESVSGSVKILGLHLDPQLNFKYQMQLLSAKLKSCLYGMRNLKPLVDKETMLKLYHGFFRGNINYLIPYMIMCTSTTLEPILKADRAAVRIIANLDFRASTGLAYRELGILTIDKAIELYAVKFMYKYANNMQPSSFSTYWKTNVIRHGDRNLRNADDFHLPNRLHPLLLWNHPLYKFPKLYNDLPYEMKTVPKLSTFVRLAREMLMTRE